MQPSFESLEQQKVSRICCQWMNILYYNLAVVWICFVAQELLQSLVVCLKAAKLIVTFIKIATFLLSVLIAICFFFHWQITESTVVLQGFQNPGIMSLLFRNHSLPPPQVSFNFLYFLHVLLAVCFIFIVTVSVFLNFHVHSLLESPCSSSLPWWSFKLSSVFQILC